MKLSNIILSSLILASVGACAQEKSPVKPVKKDSIKVIRKTDAVGKPITKLTSPTDTLKNTVPDSTKVRPISHDYCPPCGMG
jgi:hypothetical protein